MNKPPLPKDSTLRTLVGGELDDLRLTGEAVRSESAFTEKDGKAISDVSAPNDALAQLFRFHGEIRAAISLLESLVGIKQSGEREQQCARYLIHFLSGPLVWHDIDEECSLLPRLRDRVFDGDNELEPALKAISDEHVEMEHLIESLLPLLDLVARGHLPTLTFAERTRRFRNHLLPHLAREERFLLPFARLVLTPLDLSSLDEEIGSRQEARNSNANITVVPD